MPLWFINNIFDVGGGPTTNGTPLGLLLLFTFDPDYVPPSGDYVPTYYIYGF